MTFRRRRASQSASRRSTLMNSYSTSTTSIRRRYAPHSSNRLLTSTRPGHWRSSSARSPPQESSASSTRSAPGCNASDSMLPMPEDHFGERVAARYDETSADMFDRAVVEPVVDFLAELAGDGAALELGIGTGRIALPLTLRGVRVHGIDLSEAMVARLRAKPGGDRIPVTIADFATATVPGLFSLAYLVFNTIMNLTSQDEQVACFQNVAAH